MAEPSCCCKCIKWLISLGISISIFLWLILPSKPTLSIEDFYIPALNKTLNDTQNSTIFLHLKLKNRNFNKGIYYDTLDLSLRYYDQNITSPMKNVTIEGFRQGWRKKAHRTVRVQWEEAVREVANGKKVFRVDLSTKVRYKLIYRTTGRHTIMVGRNVTVDEIGTLENNNNKGVKLSCARGQVSYFASLGCLVGFILFSFLYG